MTSSPEPVYVVLESSQGWWDAWGPTLVPLVVSLLALAGVVWATFREDGRVFRRDQREAMRDAFSQYQALFSADTAAVAHIVGYEQGLAEISEQGLAEIGERAREVAEAGRRQAHSDHMDAWMKRLQQRARIDLLANQEVQRLCREADDALVKYVSSRTPGPIIQREYRPVYDAVVRLGEAMRANLGVKGGVYVALPRVETPAPRDAQPETPAQP